MIRECICSLGLALVLAATGCGSSSAGSCSTSSGGMVTTCTDYGQGYTASTVMSACASGMYSTSSCTATGRVGRCQITASTAGATASTTLNYYPPSTAAQAMSACTAANVSGLVTTVYTAN